MERFDYNETRKGFEITENGYKVAIAPTELDAIDCINRMEEILKTESVAYVWNEIGLACSKSEIIEMFNEDVEKDNLIGSGYCSDAESYIEALVNYSYLVSEVSR